MKTTLNKNFSALILLACEQEQCRLDQDALLYIQEDVTKPTWDTSYFLSLLILCVNAQQSLLSLDRRQALPYCITHDEGEPLIIEDFDHENNFSLTSAPNSLMLIINAIKILSDDFNGEISEQKCKSKFEDIVFKNDDQLIDVSFMISDIIQQTMSREFSALNAILSIQKTYQEIKNKRHTTDEQLTPRSANNNEEGQFKTDGQIMPSNSEWDMKPKGFDNQEEQNPFSL